MNKSTFSFILIFFFNFTLFGKEIDSISLQLKWTHQFQFAGFYMAKEKGFFKAAGLDVNIIQGKPGLDIVNEVVSGNAQFGIGMPNLLIRRSEGIPIILLYPIFHHSPLIILSKKSSNIKTPNDLVGKTLMLNTHRDAQFEAMFKNMSVDFVMINTIQHSWDINDLIMDKVSAVSAYSTSQPFILKEMNIEYSIMDPKSYGVDFFGDCLFSSEEYVKKNKRITDAFIVTSKEGWRYALENIDETIDVILRDYNPNLTREFLKYEAYSSKDLIDVHSSSRGDDDRHENRWQYIQSVYKSKGLIKKNVNIHKFIYHMENESFSESLQRNLTFILIATILMSVFLFVVLFFNRRLRKIIDEKILEEKSKNFEILRRKELDELLYKTLVSLNEMHQLSILDIMDYSLENAVKLTGSKIGYIYFYDEDAEMLTLFSWSRSVMPECKVMNPKTDYELSKTGLWGEAIRQRKPIITNDYKSPNKFKKGIPEGHVPLRSHTNVPIFYEGKIVALIGVGNKEDDYTDTDVRHLSILMDGVWSIKSQREMAEKVKESETLYRTLFNNAAEGIVLVNIEELRMEYVNEAFKKMLGYSEDEFKQIEIFKLNPENEQPLIKDFFEKAVNSKESSYFPNIPFVSKEGTTFFFDLRTQKIMVFGKEYLLGLFANITERKNAEEEVRKINLELENRIEERTKELKDTLNRLSESEEMHRVMFETMTQGVVYQNKDGYVTRVNQAAVNLLGVDLDQFQGRTSMDPRWKTIHEDGSVFPGDEHPAMKALEEGVIIKDVVIGIFNPRLEKYVWANVTAVPLFRDGEDKPYQVYAILEDITEKRKVALELQEAKENAEKANRAKSEFLANMSHEIRTPLNAVTGFSELLSGLLVDEKQMSYVASIKSAGKSLLTLINDILDLSKIEAGMMEIQNEPVNIKALLTEIYSIFSVKAREEHLMFNIDIPEIFPDFILLDETRLRQVLLNLVGNAFKFTHKGFVNLHIEILRIENNENLDLAIVVDDSGIGIKEDEQQNIFESFRQQEGQSTRIYGGTGLGLSICRKLIEMMNGHISVISKPREGSQFKIVLEKIQIIKELKATTKDEDTINYKALIFNNPKILIVDDIASNRDVIRELLIKHNCTTIEAENGEEAIQIVKYNKPDAIIMDVRMPIMDGKTATKKLKDDEKFKDIPIIALTASVTNKEFDDIKKLGFNSYLSKPVDVKELFNVLRSVLSNKIVEAENDILNEDIEYPSVNKETLRILKGAVEENIIPEFNKMIRVMKMKKLKDFSLKLDNLSHEFSYMPLKIIADKLAFYIDVFDVIAIKELEKTFYDIVENLNSQERGGYDW